MSRQFIESSGPCGIDPEYGGSPLQAEALFGKIEAWLTKKGIVERYQLPMEQRASVESLEKIADGYLKKFSRDPLARITDQIYNIKSPVGGVGFVPGFPGMQKIYLLEAHRMPLEQFNIAVAHELAHLLGYTEIRALSNGGMSFMRCGFKQVDSRGRLKGYILEEGFADILARRMLKEIGRKFEPCPGYVKFTEIIDGICQRISEDHPEVGEDMFLEWFLTGNDSKIRQQLNRIFQNKGGFEKFIKLLDEPTVGLSRMERVSRVLSRGIDGTIKNLSALLFGSKITPSESYLANAGFRKIMNWIEL